MATSFGALCTDFYVNQKLALKMDLPGDRETILHLFDRVRKSVPSMDRFYRYESELALESSRRESEYRWLSIRRTSIRTGHVNPGSMSEAYKYHKLMLDVAPFHLTISPLDIDYLELLLGFDLECKGNHDEVVFDALYAGTPLAGLMKIKGHKDARVMDVQPLFGLSLSKSGDLQAFYEVKTRSRGRRGSTKSSEKEPLSIFLTLRRYGPIAAIEELPKFFDTLRDNAEKLAADHLVPELLAPISRHITSNNA